MYQASAAVFDFGLVIYRVWFSKIKKDPQTASLKNSITLNSTKTVFWCPAVLHRDFFNQPWCIWITHVHTRHKYQRFWKHLVEQAFSLMFVLIAAVKVPNFTSVHSKTLSPSNICYYLWIYGSVLIELFSLVPWGTLPHIVNVISRVCPLTEPTDFKSLLFYPSLNLLLTVLYSYFVYWFPKGKGFCLEPFLFLNNTWTFQVSFKNLIFYLWRCWSAQMSTLHLTDSTLFYWLITCSSQ